MVTTALPRSDLFVPADRPERIDKALSSRADAVIVDLEDAVAPAARPAAREALGQWLSGAGAGEPSRLIVRISPPGSRWFEDDRATCRFGGAGVVMLPKAERVVDLAAVRRAMPRTVLTPLVETAEGFARRAELAPTIDGVTTAVAVDGKRVDQPVVHRAQALLRQGRAG